MRNWLFLFVSLAALAGSIVAALATREQRNFELRGYVDPTQDQNLPYRVPRLGVNASLEQYTSEELQFHLDLMESANITWIRQEIPWDQIETAPGEFAWQPWDRVIEAVDKYNQLQLILVLNRTPGWARHQSALDFVTAPPQSPADFAQFSAQVAERYGDSVDVYQIWDEPNLEAAWGGLDPRPAEYLALMQAGYDAIHAADPNAVVLSAALAPTTEQGPQNISDWQYLKSLYNLGAADYLDGVGAKPYGFAHGPDDRTVHRDRLNASRVARLREIMVEHGDGDKAIWASNWGWNSLPTDWTGEPSIWGEVTQQEQINYSFRFLERAEREWPWMAGMTLHHWHPIAEPDDPQWGFALVSPANEPTPLLQALQDIPPFTTAYNGLFPADNPYATYQGVWTFGQLGADIGWLSDSRLAFEFTGSDLALLVRQGDYVAYLYPEINGTAPNALPQDADGNAYMILTDPLLKESLKLVSVANGLSPAQHTLTVTADRGWDRWVLVGYAVSSGNLAAPYNQQIVLAWVASVLAAGAVVLSLSRFRWTILQTRFVILVSPLNGIWQYVIGAIASLILLLGVFLTWGDGTPAIFRREPVVLGLSILSAGLLYVEPWLPLSGVAALILFWVFFNRVEVGLMLTLAWAPFFLFPVQLYLYFFPMAELLLLTTFAAWLARQTVRAVERFQEGTSTTFAIRPSAMDLGIVAFVGVSLLSLVWTTYLDPAVTELRTLIIEPALFYLMLRTTVQYKKQLVRLIDTLLISGLAVALIGLGMYVFGEGIITAEGGTQRLAGVYGSPNNVALFLGRVVPFALCYLLIPVTPIRRWLGIATLIIGLGAIALTQSVGAVFIGVPFALAMVLILVLRQRALLPLLGMVIIGGILFVILLQFPRFGRVLDFSSGTNFFRLRVWQSAINVIGDHPLTGLGLDQFLYFFRGQYIFPDAWQEPDLSHPHNFILDFWTRLGIGGLFVFGWLQIVFWRRVVSIYRATNSSPLAQCILIGVTGAMVNLLGHGLVDNSVFVIDLAIIFVFLLAIPQVLDSDST